MPYCGFMSTREPHHTHTHTHTWRQTCSLAKVQALRLEEKKGKEIQHLLLGTCVKKKISKNKTKSRSIAQSQI